MEIIFQNVFKRLKKWRKNEERKLKYTNESRVVTRKRLNIGINSTISNCFDRE